MRKISIPRFLAVSIFGAACTGLNTGCVNWSDVQFGFSAALGAAPANTLAAYLSDLFFSATSDGQ